MSFAYLQLPFFVDRCPHVRPRLLDQLGPCRSSLYYTFSPCCVHCSPLFTSKTKGPHCPHFTSPSGSKWLIARGSPTVPSKLPWSFVGYSGAVPLAFASISVLQHPHSLYRKPNTFEYLRKSSNPPNFPASSRDKICGSQQRLWARAPRSERDT